MTIGQYIRLTDIKTYKKLKRLYKIDKPKKKIELGDTVESLMNHRSYKRTGRRIKQRGWG